MNEAALFKALDRSARFLLTAAVALVPLIFLPASFGQFHLVKLTTLSTLALLAFAAWSFANMVRPGRRPAPASFGAAWMSVALLAVAGLATLLSPNPRLSLFGFYQRYEGLASIILYVGFFLIVLRLYGGRGERLHELVQAIGAAGGLVSVLTLVQRLGPTMGIRAAADFGNAPTGPVGNPVFTASYLGITAPFVLYLWSSSTTSRRKLLWLVVGLLMSAALIVTQGIVGVVAACVGILSYFVLVSTARRNKKFAVIVLAIVALGFAPLVTKAMPSANRFLEWDAVGFRVEMWSATVEMFMARPGLGWGPESFLGEYPRFRTALEARSEGLKITDKPHNIFLNWAATTGAIGALLYAALVGYAIRGAAGVARNGSESSRARLMAAFGGGLAAYVVQGLFLIDVPPLAHIGWVCVAAIFVLERRNGGPLTDEGLLMTATRSRTRGHRLHAVAGTGIILVVALGLAIGFTALRADVAAWAAERSGRQGWSSAAADRYEKAIALNPFEPVYHVIKARYFERMAADPLWPEPPSEALFRAVLEYERALEMHPRHVHYMIQLAGAYAKIGATTDSAYFEDANLWLRRATHLDRLDPELHILYARFLEEWSGHLRGKARRYTEIRAQQHAAIADRLNGG